MIDPCAGVFVSRLCRFEPRYDLIPPPVPNYKGDADIFPDAMRALTKQIYVCDICVRCGKIVKREAA